MNFLAWSSFVDNFTSSLVSTVTIDACFSYRVDHNLMTSEHYFQNISRHVVDYYLKEIQEHDPLFIGKNILNEKNMLVLSQQSISEQYYAFMQSHHVGDNVELYFKLNNIPIRGISLIRHKEKGRFTKEELDLLQSYHNFTNHYLKQELTKDTPQNRFPLDLHHMTKKEQEIIKLICAGKNNEQIAQMLFISMSTVKTHIQHIFQKIGVNSKHQLVTKLFAIA
ncbi:response regulator transcription factor [Acinetobacter sp. CE-15]|uniref:response regulator transcription factor n=1 Tax=Acinetobacter sp. CE-15 TaxID=3425693 RepID=UPI003DA6642A